MVTTAIFDMDGLLVDSEPLWRDAMREVFASIGIEFSTEQAAYTTGLRTKEVIDFWYDQFRWTGRTKEQVVNDIIDSVTAKIQAGGHGMEGLEYILDFFHSRGFKMGVASSSPMRLINVVLEHLQIRNSFQTVASAELEEHGKPHPAVYLNCARELGSHPLQCIAFEDSVTGMVAAKAARMKAVVVPEENKRNDTRFSLADIKLNSLLEFNEEVLNRLK